MQKRNLLLTDKYLYNFMELEFRRKVDITKLKALTKNLTDAGDFVVHVADEYDYRYKSPDRERLMELIRRQFNKETGKDLQVYGVKGHMTNYITSQKDHEARHVKGLPPAEYKLEGEAACHLNDPWKELSGPAGNKGFFSGFFKSKDTGSGVKTEDTKEEIKQAPA